MAILSNFVARYAKAEAFLPVAAPKNSISLASSIDNFTPVVKNDGNLLDKSYASTTEAFVALNTSVETQLTAREEPLPDNSASTVYYTVRNGDNLTTLGWKFEVKISTLKYLNDISDADLISPGQKMKIPPKGYEVSETLIAKKEAEARLAANRSTTSSSSASSASASSGVQYVKYTPGNRYNGYPYGYCTYYVATKRSMPTSLGNAKNWLNSASRAGYSTGSNPAVGAIVVTSESWWGHVAFVESVSGNNITISEMNYSGWGVVSRRTISADSGVVRGFIY